MNTTKLSPAESGAMWIFAGTLCLIILLTGTTILVKQYNRKNIAGQWKMTFIHERDSYNADANEINTHQILFTQNEETVAGAGQNANDMQNSSSHKMEYSGIVDNDVLKATYKLPGKQHETTGRIEVTITDDGKNLMGTFAGNADNAKGTVMGERLDH